ncbi:hypothetical protein [Celeribacter indicus]|uniref:hypothetical protein n=1 Tax=Celeribacter indicus TaxID=1208324 RepID=UPI0005C336BE|nr:hypothetical protein [Celeribacter indicus]SDW42531.1 hypothetical protein SAMN05443573_103175 [Celeribacter indicus]
MKRIVAALTVAVGLSACGVEGEPVQPEVHARTTVGVNSKWGSYTDTSVNIHFPLNFPTN